MKQGAHHARLSEEDILKTFENLGLENETQRRKFSFFVESEEKNENHNFEIKIVDNTAFQNKVE